MEERFLAIEHTTRGNECCVMFTRLGRWYERGLDFHDVVHKFIAIYRRLIKLIHVYPVKSEALLICFSAFCERFFPIFIHTIWRKILESFM